uniref:Uncharacterized protein n=1 Tax=Romanomermis culicivorax TaxID=13658 RepID=A0A915I7X0_ROMCU
MVSYKLGLSQAPAPAPEPALPRFGARLHKTSIFDKLRLNAPSKHSIAFIINTWTWRNCGNSDSGLIYNVIIQLKTKAFVKERDDGSFNY